MYSWMYSWCFRWYPVTWHLFGDKPLPETVLTKTHGTLWHHKASVSLTHWPLGDLNVISKMYFSIFFHWLVSSDFLMITPSDECHIDKSTLVQVMAWCRQATSHYQSQCWPRSVSPYNITRPQWVKLIHWRSGVIYSHWKPDAHCGNALRPEQNGHLFADNIFICIFSNWKSCIFILISMYM